MMDRLSPTCCPRSEHALSRRALLHGALAGGVAFGGFGRLFADDHAAAAKKNEKRVILVFMSGGPSQFETWDPKPGQPTGGPHISIPTSIPGVHFDEYMPNLSRLANRMATVRSMTSRNGDHDQGGYIAQTAYNPSAVVVPAPHWLSVCAHEKPVNEPGLPSYVMLGRDNFGTMHVPGAGYLGARYQALHCAGGGAGPQDLPKASEEAIAAFARREKLRSSFSESFAAGRDKRFIESHEGAFAQVGNLLRSGDLFDIQQEPQRDFDRYGSSQLGRDCLLARRLVERGVPFVRVQHQSGLAWDKHRRAFQSQRWITSEFDTAVGALIDDLVDRGLWSNTLLVLMGEFGRTPEISGQGQPGRNHWTKCWSLSFGGCGLKEGLVIGSTNENGTDLKDRPVTIHDLFCTFYKTLDINPHKELQFENRPIPFVEDKLGKPIAEVF
ncbi:hypothetical protein ETAA8_01130 [Anatilimnocola aggregata]|uniref:DUF1501 domain-containing protein n=1 Tax=Anatilimnocola aggregata TaxID=2528021 RepID=A0A517Y4J5_9BACT|nr:DUF1501 domain-containing protein [Anatilimnocola aggregata]QDU25052.1 hypothetical protein ETAA8_01130 [Anatilimnocola aggregata]